MQNKHDYILLSMTTILQMKSMRKLNVSKKQKTVINNQVSTQINEIFVNTTSTAPVVKIAGSTVQIVKNTV